MSKVKKIIIKVLFYLLIFLVFLYEEIQGIKIQLKIQIIFSKGS